VIETQENASTIELAVRDDGDGFDPASRTAGFGLLGMRERVRLLRGTIQVACSPGNGTTIAASFPVQRRPGKEPP
jgi:two-component system, NarL family, sensor histidine kinase UhpB